MKEKPEEIFRSCGGQLRMSEAIKRGMSRYMLYALRDRGVIEQISRGVYRLVDLPPISNPDLVTVALRVPNAVVCLVSALAYHEITTQIPHSISISLSRVTLGNHLRRRRLQLGLYQKDVATQIGVTTSTIWNWENNWSSITLRCMPKVIEFLGYNPIPCPVGLMGRLAWYKQVNGLSLEQLGVNMGRDPEQLSNWLSGRHKPCRRNREEIELFLSGHVQGPDPVQRSGAALPEESPDP